MKKLFLLSVFLVFVGKPNFVMAQPNDSLYFVYVGDPMCSWCYGFSGELKKLNKRYQNQIGLNVIVGGLRPYTTEPWDREMREFLKEHWIEIEQRTGETLNYGILTNQEFILDTEPSCRAYKVLEHLGANKLIAFHEVQKVFYVENKNPLKIESFRSCCEKLKINFEEFKQNFESEKFKMITKQDFQLAQKMGVTGFPTLLLVLKDKVFVLARGYQKAENLFPQIDKVIADQ